MLRFLILALIILGCSWLWRLPGAAQPVSVGKGGTLPPQASGLFASSVSVPGSHGLGGIVNGNMTLGQQFVGGQPLNVTTGQMSGVNATSGLSHRIPDNVSLPLETYRTSTSHDLDTPQVQSLALLTVQNAVKREQLAGSTVWFNNSTNYNKHDNDTIYLREGELFVSVGHPTRALTIKTEYGEIQVSRRADVVVVADTSSLKVQNLDGLGKVVQVKVHKASGSDSEITLNAGYEVIVAEHALSAEDWQVTDGVARRNKSPGQDGSILVSEVWIPSVVAHDTLIAQVRHQPLSLQNKVIDNIIKMAAIIQQTRGNEGFEIDPFRPGQEVALQSIRRSLTGKDSRSNAIEVRQEGGNSANQVVDQTLGGESSELAGASSQSNISRLGSLSRIPTDVTHVKFDRKRMKAEKNVLKKRQQKDGHKRGEFPNSGESDQFPATRGAESLASLPVGVMSNRGQNGSMAMARGGNEVRDKGNNDLRAGAKQFMRSVVQGHPDEMVALLLAVAALMCSSVYLAQAAVVKARQLRALNRELESEINERQTAEGQVKELNVDLERRISELAVLNEHIEMARDHALAASRLKSEFVANVSHELRTPISIVLGMNELLLETPLTKEQHEYAKYVHEAVVSLLAIINDLLDFSKIEAGKLELENVTFSPATAVKESVAIISPAAEEKGLEVNVQWQENIPENVIGDPVRLRQVLLNLLGNAIKFTDEGQVMVSVAIERETVDKIWLRYSVQDTGIGISTSAMTRLFQAFVQADGSTTRRYGGTGLGLSICKHLVGLMGGTIEVESEEHRGSKFWLILPFDKLESSLDTRALQKTA